MSLTGTLKSWNDDRGFGFIARTHGGRDLFVHISAFPRDGSRPTVGETLNYEIGLGENGKPQAVRVYREGQPSAHARTRSDVRARRSLFAALIGFVFLVLFGAYVYSTYQAAHLEAPALGHTEEVGSSPQPANVETPDPKRVGKVVSSPQSADQKAPTPAPTEEVVAPARSVYRCDGRTRCSQMTSCSEAEFFLKNCPGVQMDGDNDGVPCEQQWCGSP